MKEIAEANPRLLSLSTLYPVAKEDFVLHLFYAHKDKEKYVILILPVIIKHTLVWVKNGDYHVALKIKQPLPVIKITQDF